LRKLASPMTPSRPLLYVKSSCSWCDDAEAFLKERGIAYDTANVSADRAAFDEMVRLSGQTKAPTLNWDGEVLADFGTEELEAFLRDLGVVK
jgi:glutaredoxin 3